MTTGHRPGRSGQAACRKKTAAGDLLRATEERYILAEGPTWDPVREVLLWLDVEAGLVMAGDLSADGRIAVRETVSLGETVGAVAVTESGDWVIAGAERLYVRSAGGAVRPGRRILPRASGRRLNDGKPDPAGRFVVGTLSLTRDASSSEELIVVRAEGLDRIDGDLTLSNGLAWSADGGTLYSVDTHRRVVFRRPWNVAGGTWGERATHLSFATGYPDGICLDAEEHLWVAMWGLGEVRRYAPDGALVATLLIPAPHPSSVAFAGSDLDVLVITTASRDLAGDDLARHPAAGTLFTVRPGVRGLPAAMCAAGAGLEEARA